MTGSDNHTLQMWLGETHIGDLTYNSTTETFAICYTDFWQREGFALSPELPLDGSATSLQVTAFLSNLLPENQGLDYLIDYLAVSRGNTFALIKGIGLDTSGAVTFIPPDTIKPETNFIRISEAELLKRLDHPDVWPLEIWENRPRLSVAGVQSKLNLFMVNDEYGFGEGDLCSTHIIKFEQQSHQHLVINEFITMHLARAIGFHTAEVSLMRVGPHRALAIKRFDRKYDPDSSKVYRRHMIDACQALGGSVNKKYERNFGDGRDVAHIREGVNLKHLFGLTRYCTNPAQAKLNILQWVLFNLVVSNYDAHGKNFSFFVSGRGLEPTPWYDLVNVSMYPQFSQTFAMAIGDEFNPKQIHAWQLLDFAQMCGIHRNLLMQTLTQICTRIPEQIDTVFSFIQDKNDAESRYIEQYAHKINQRCNDYLLQIKEMPFLEL
jgi:serine/threonine-protein kinase HipA